MKRLYTVKLETEIVVVAESMIESEDIGRASFHNLGPDEIASATASPLRRLPGEWDENCYPYGAGSKSIKTLVSEGAAPEYIGK